MVAFIAFRFNFLLNPLVWRCFFPFSICKLPMSSIAGELKAPVGKAGKHKSRFFLTFFLLFFLLHAGISETLRQRGLPSPPLSATTQTLISPAQTKKERDRERGRNRRIEEESPRSTSSNLKRSKKRRIAGNLTEHTDFSNAVKSGNVCEGHNRWIGAYSRTLMCGVFGLPVCLTAIAYCFRLLLSFFNDVVFILEAK